MNRIKSYNFKGGGLVKEDIPTQKELLLSVPQNFTVPKEVDSTFYCVPASNQGQEPKCAAYATVGYVEVMDWQYTHVAKQIDPDPVYAGAKKLDGSPNTDGTSLTACVRACQMQGLIPIDYAPKVIQTRQDLEFAMHRDGVCLGAFEITDEWNRVNTKTGAIWDDEKSEFIGYHGVLICKYNLDGVKWQNSWSQDWGCDGFGTMNWKQFMRQFRYGVALESPLRVWGGKKND